MDIADTLNANRIMPAANSAGGQESSVSKWEQDSLDKQVDVAQKFEGMLLQQMFKQVHEGLEAMKQDSQDEEDSDSDACGEQFQSLFWSQMADVVSQQGGVGYWKTIYAEVHQDVLKTENPGSLLNEGL